LAVALSPDPANRFRDVVASDTISRAEPDKPLKAALAGNKGLGTAAVYASNGIWYDALEAVTNEIDVAQRNKDVHFLRASFLEQAGLKKAAASER
jgi:hypothetical protein